MKNLFALTMVVALASTLTYAQPWAHRDVVGGQAFATTNVLSGATLTMSYEWNQTSWNASDIGWGTNFNGSSWTWQDCPWWADGGGSDKRCRTNVTFSTSGTNYYAFRLNYSGGTFYLYGQQDGWSDIELQTTLTPTTNSYVYVIPEGGMIGLLAAGIGWLGWRKR
jgi:hypothetical protein